MSRARLTAFLFAVTLSAVSAAKGVELKVTVTVTSLNKGGFVEFKAESDQKGEKATGHLTKVGESKTWTWKMGNAKQNIWYWWDTLDGAADLKIEMTGAPGKPVVLFEAPCEHKGKGEVQVGKTIKGGVASLRRGKNHYRRNRGLGPHIEENEKGANTHIKECDAEPREMPAKAGNEWDEVGE